jgi:serine phosphatase RsbU (regulator of sigma subunit)
MSSLESQGELVKGLEAGADDFLVKPVHGGVLNAKIRTMQRIARTNAELSEAAQLLERYRDGAEGELQLARNLIQHMINRDGLKDPALEWFVLPSAKFSGDLVASVREESDRLYVFFADASGHGLAAAISGLPVLQIFYAMAAKGIAVGEIAREMNIKLKEYLPMGRYLAAILVCVDFGRREVQVWNGGMPTGLVLVDGESKTNDALQSRQVPLCVIGNELFDANAVRFSWNETTRLLFVSDGVLEATDPAGEPFGMSRLLKSAGRRGQNGLVAPILQALRLHQRGAAAHDDVSILTITLP